MGSDSDNATILLNRLQDGDAQTGEQLLPLWYDELKAIARRQFRGQPDGTRSRQRCWFTKPSRA